MIISYFKIAWRNLLRCKLFSLINIAGLACGIAVSLLMLIHIRHELSYETFYPDYNLICRVGTVHWAKTPPSLAPALRHEVPEMSMIGRFFREGSKVLAHNDKQIPTQNNYLIDPSILSIFNFEFIYGNPAKALSETHSIILTRDVADKFFPGINPVGQVLKVDDQNYCTITGIIENIPSNSHLKIETLTSIVGTDTDLDKSVSWHAVDTYVRFRSSGEVQQASHKLREFQYRFLEGRTSKDDIDRGGDYYELHPISDIHLYSHREKEIGRNSDILYIYLFSVLSVFIIFVASINFINLFTAQSVRRMKEIGVKKVIGASRKQLIQQFLCETLLLTLASALLGLIIAETVLPFYNSLSGLALRTTDLFETSNIFVLAAIIVLVAILSGLYPAVVISGYKIAESLKSRYSPKAGVSLFRRVLVTFQFVISGLVIIITGIVFQQMHYIHNRDLGFSQKSVVTVKLYGLLAKNVRDNKETLKGELLRNHNIRSVSVSNRVIGERLGYEWFALANSRDEERIDARFIRADDGFVSTLGLTLIEGRNFLPDDTVVSYILNEEAYKLLGVKDLVGRQGGDDSNNPKGEIIGIVKNFNFASLHSQIEPLVIECPPMRASNLLIKINNTQDPGPTLAYIEKVISEFTPGSLVVFNFLDDQLNLLYQTENNIFATFQVFSVLSVVIASLGLLALSAHTVESRVKEIGIRKVLGATIPNIIFMLTNDYMRLVAVASILSIPIAYYVADLWLAAFAYHITLSSWMFILPGIILIVFTLLIVTAQSLKAAMTDPVKSLRYE